jgi:opacity protein-like surface antigen
MPGARAPEKSTKVLPAGELFVGRYEKKSHAHASEFFRFQPLFLLLQSTARHGIIEDSRGKMKRKYILPVLVLALWTRGGAMASGLYLSAGYSRPSSSFESKQALPAPDNYSGITGNTCPNCWMYDFSDISVPLEYVPYWPDSATGDSAGILEWENGQMGTLEFKPKNKNEFIYAIGWDFGGTPWRVELEQSKVSFSSDGYDLVMPQSCAAGNLLTCEDGGTPPADYWTFHLNGYQGGILNATATSLMVNAYFTLPFLGHFDPYVGVGIGRTKIDTAFGPQSGGSGDENAYQFMLGMEYWIPDTGWAVGFEYRQLTVSDAQERDDPSNYLNFTNKAMVFKLRYDFMADEF